LEIKKNGSAFYSKENHKNLMFFFLERQKLNGFLFKKKKNLMVVLALAFYTRKGVT